MACFQAKTRWERPRKSENKKFCYGHSYSISNRELKKIQTIRKHQYGFFSGQNRLGKAEKE